MDITLNSVEDTFTTHIYLNALSFAITYNKYNLILNFLFGYIGLARKFVRFFRVEWNTIYILQN